MPSNVEILVFVANRPIKAGNPHDVEEIPRHNGKYRKRDATSRCRKPQHVHTAYQYTRASCSMPQTQYQGYADNRKH